MHAFHPVNNFDCLQYHYTVVNHHALVQVNFYRMYKIIMANYYFCKRSLCSDMYVYPIGFKVSHLIFIFTAQHYYNNMILLVINDVEYVRMA